MDIKKTEILLIQKHNTEWNYTEYSRTISNNTWNKLKSEHDKFELIKTTKKAGGVQLIILPSTEELQTIKYNEIFLISKGTKHVFEKLLPELSNQLWEVNEEILTSGCIKKELTEPEINKALRNVFTYRSKRVFILLANSFYNQIHQSNIKNVLYTAGVMSHTPAV